MYRLFEEKIDRQLIIMQSYFDQHDEKLDKLTEKTRETRQRLAGLEQEVRQPRLATKANVESDTKTRKRTESAAVDRAKHNGNISSAKKVDIGSTSLTSFGMMAEPLALPSRDDALVGKGAEAPKSYFSPVEKRTLTTAGGLLPAGTVFTAMRTIFPRPLFSWSHGKTKNKCTSRTDNQPAPPCWRRVVQTNARQTLVLDPGSSTGHLRACPFSGG